MAFHCEARAAALKRLICRDVGRSKSIQVLKFATRIARMCGTKSAALGKVLPHWEPM
jgi:hypothetical protein